MSPLVLTKCHIVGNHMSLRTYEIFLPVIAAVSLQINTIEQNIVCFAVEMLHQDQLSCHQILSKITLIFLQCLII